MACRLPAGADLAAFAERVLRGESAGAEVVRDGEGAGAAFARVVEAALRDAGIVEDVPEGRRVEVVVGRTNENGHAPTGFMTGHHTATMARGVRHEVRAGEASGLVALDVGFRALASRRADLAVVGEVDDGPEGEAIGVIVLERLADAEREGDRIYAVVRGVAFGGGRRRARASRRAQRLAGADPATVGLAIDRRPGMAGIIEAALALHHRTLPPASPGTASRPWVHGDLRQPRRAGVGATAGDLAAYTLLEGHATSARPDAPGVLTSWETEAILLGAPDRTSWLKIARALFDWLESDPDVPLKDVAFTLNTSQPYYPFRVGLVVGSLADLKERIGSLLGRLADPECRSIRDARGTYFREEPLAGRRRLAFLFPGEGSQYPGMLADLCPHFPEVSALFDTADRVARERGLSRLPSEALFGGGGEPDLWSVELAINVVLSAQWALYQLLLRLGIRPDVVAGHSSGEFLALAAAGALRIDRTFEDRIGDLGAVFERLEADGALPVARLVAVAADRDRVEAACREAGGAARIAMDNCPHQVVVAGAPADVDGLVARLRGQGVVFEPLPFERAYHTPEFAPALGPVREFLASFPIERPVVPIYSCAVAGRVPDDPATVRALAVEQWARPVEFRSTVEALYADGVRLFVEVGARGNLTGFVEDTLRGRPQFAVAANLPRRSGLTQINHLVAALFAHGVPVVPDHLYARRRPSRVDFAADPGPKPRDRSRISINGFHKNEKISDSLVIHESARVVDSIGVDLAPVIAEADGAILSYLRTMDVFLATQREVMTAYLAATAIEPAFDPVTGGEEPGPAPDDVESIEPGPWLGAIERLEPGRELVAVRRLDARDDPVAENHTLGGRRVSALDPGRKGLPVVPFAVMAEMLAEAAAPLAIGKVLVALRDVRAHRWIKYEEQPVALEIRARSISNEPDAFRVQVFNRGTPSAPRDPAEGPVVEGVVAFAESRPEAPPAPSFVLADPGPCRFTAEGLYRDQWLFHGPPFRALVRVGASSPDGIEGALRVLPASGLLKPGKGAGLHIDPIALDVFTHLLGCWGLDKLTDGDVIFPLAMGELAIFAPDPPEGSEVACRIRIEAVERHRVRVAADLVTPAGRVWMRLSGWEDWRFYWPNRYRDVFRAPDRVLVGEPLPTPEGLCAVWLEPPADMSKPVWRDVLEWVQLGPDERAALLATDGDESSRTLRLWGRIAAKEAVRRLWLARGDAPCYPADLVVEHDDRDRPRLRSLLPPQPDAMPAISIATAGCVAVALASADPTARVGIAVERVTPRGPDFEHATFADSERLLLGRLPDREGWVARLRCARTAAAKAFGLDPRDGPGRPTALDVDAATGIVTVGPGPTSAGAGAQVISIRKNDYAIAWTRGERNRPR
ncbi:MAG TPA: acyltransferase domain-containing protein [Isosphaeraceae bacterium]|nr:acyltransferase domain-containing protein [Isosphaeraceae bacterium]